MEINYELYKVFYFVAKNLSFSEASQELRISQSAVSQSIKVLETTLKCRLFIRSTKQVRLTPEGDLLFQHIEQAFNLIFAGERNLQEMQTLKQGEIRIGASDTICKYHLLPYFQRFHRLYPEIKIKVTNRTSPVCIDLVKKGTVDISIVNIPHEGNSGSKNLHFTALQTIQDVFVAGNAFAHLKNRKITLAELTHYPLLLLEQNSVTRCYFEDLIRQHRVRLTPEFELGSIDLIIDLVKIGLGASFIAKEYVANEIAAGELFQLDVDIPVTTRYWGVATIANIPLPRAAKKFIELLQTNNPK